MERSKGLLASKSPEGVIRRAGPPRTSSPFDQISPILYEYSPRDTAHSFQPDPVTKETPSTIVLFGSSNGPLHALNRFARGYSALFPGARILAVLCLTRMLFFQSDQTTQEDMQPLLQELSKSRRERGNGFISKNEDSNDIPAIIFHSFSNGGLLSLRALCLAWREAYASAVPHAMLVMDSCPGSGCFNTEAFRWAESAAAPFIAGNSIASKVPGSKALAHMAGLGLVTAAVKLPELMTGRENLVAAGRKAVGDARMLDPRSVMLYIYSTDDEAIRWQDVEENIAEVRGKYMNRNVSALRLARSNHLGHEKVHSDLYWREIKKVWDESAPALLGQARSKL